MSAPIVKPTLVTPQLDLPANMSQAAPQIAPMPATLTSQPTPVTAQQLPMQQLITPPPQIIPQSKPAPLQGAGPSELLAKVNCEVKPLLAPTTNGTEETVKQDPVKPPEQHIPSQVAPVAAPVAPSATAVLPSTQTTNHATPPKVATPVQPPPKPPVVAAAPKPPSPVKTEPPKPAEPPVAPKQESKSPEKPTEVPKPEKPQVPATIPPPKPSNKRKRETKALLGGAESTSTGDDQRARRNRTQTQPYQVPLAPSDLGISPRQRRAKSPEEKLIVFYKNEFLAVRNAEGGFYVCQAMQNIYRKSQKIHIRWLSQEKGTAEPEVVGETPQADGKAAATAGADLYSPDFYDTTEFDCILTNLHLVRVDKGKYRLPEEELVRTKNILSRAIAVEKGSEKPQVSEGHPDGLDLSLFNSQTQLKPPPRKRSTNTAHKQTDSSESSEESDSSDEEDEESEEEPKKKSQRKSPAAAKTPAKRRNSSEAPAAKRHKAATPAGATAAAATTKKQSNAQSKKTPRAVKTTATAGTSSSTKKVVPPPSRPPPVFTGRASRSQAAAQTTEPKRKKTGK